MTLDREGKKVTKEEMANAVKSKEEHEMVIGGRREVPHVCLDCGFEFTMTMYDSWYDHEPGNKMPFYIRIEKTCPKCGTYYIAKLMPDGSRVPLVEPKPVEVPVEPVPALTKGGERAAAFGFNVRPLPESRRVEADGGTMGKSESRKRREKEEKAKARGQDQKKGGKKR
jgi:hypothetical protein